MNSDGLKLKHPQIMSRVLNRPLLLESTYSRTFVDALAKSGDTSVTFFDGAGAQLQTGDAPERQQKSYEVIDGVAILPVSGTLVHKYGHVQPYSGCTGYDGILARALEADADDGVHTIMMDIDSPGGEVSGCQELGRALANIDKPVVAFVDEMACSAAYWLASSCDLIVGPASANIGSIGVVWMHADYSKNLEDSGVKVTFIHAGAHKVDGNPYEALSDDVRASFQAEIDTLYSMFVGAVANGRTAMSEDQVRATEARVFLAADALELGLIDGVMGRAEFFEFISDVRSDAGATLTPNGPTVFTLQKSADNFSADSSQTISDGSSQGNDMTTEPTGGVQMTQAEFDALVATAKSDARKEATAEFQSTIDAAAERSNTIFSHATASDTVKTMLAGSAFAGVETTSIVALMDAVPTGYEAAMDAEGGADVGAQPQAFVDPSKKQADDQRKSEAAQAISEMKPTII